VATPRAIIDQHRIRTVQAAERREIAQPPRKPSNVDAKFSVMRGAQGTPGLAERIEERIEVDRLREHGNFVGSARPRTHVAKNHVGIQLELRKSGKERLLFQSSVDERAQDDLRSKRSRLWRRELNGRSIENVVASTSQQLDERQSGDWVVFDDQDAWPIHFLSERIQSNLRANGFFGTELGRTACSRYS
jgi:hypothetical protein